MYSNLDLKMLTTFNRHLFDVISHLNSKISSSNRVMLVQKPGVNLHFSFALVETTTCHVCLTDSLNLLEAKLIAKLVKSVVNLIK